MFINAKVDVRYKLRFHANLCFQFYLAAVEQAKKRYT